MARGRFKRWPVASEIIGGPVSLPFDWPVWPANIFILDLRQTVPLQLLQLVPCCIYVSPLHVSQLYWHRPSRNPVILS